ncbi:hypothetical protein BGX28_010335 [Mortierella sp. GBA30]|nr:hypothetical protein BGX28_010335 [Mortierella sp. GBA30]
MSPTKLSTAIWNSANSTLASQAAANANTDGRPQFGPISDSLQSSSGMAGHAPHSAKQLAAVLEQGAIPRPRPLYYNNPRTVPPVYNPAVVSLLQSVTGKSVDPVLPEPLFKPLHGKREANLRWRFFTKQIGKLKAPLPGKIRQEMERKARLGLRNPGKAGVPADDVGGAKTWKRLLGVYRARVNHITSADAEADICRFDQPSRISRADKFEPETAGYSE